MATYLNDGGSSSNGIVRHGLVAASKYGVGLASESFGNSDGEAAVDRGSRNKCRARYGDKGCVNLSHAVGWLKSIALGS